MMWIETSIRRVVAHAYHFEPGHHVAPGISEFARGIININETGA